ncbi:hypothetical protein ACH5RR_036057 [Cinchona calisaya]|uniref:F-box domain-containing protein n=1 Tax=Cinchona calisaya TaxID=153742 RepID=A0ABD2Y3B5_9GENT
MINYQNPKHNFLDEMKRTSRGNYVVQIPEEIVLEILKELPAKSLLRFKCVSKGWRNMIEDPEFVDAYRVRSRKHSTNILVRKNCFGMNQEGKNRPMDKFFLVDSNRKSVPIAVPELIYEEMFLSNFVRPYVMRPVEGLVCLNNLIWNPTTGKIIDLPPRNITNSRDIIARGYKLELEIEIFLGFDASSKKYKVLSICHTRVQEKSHPEVFIVGWQDEELPDTKILTLGTNSWRNTTNCSLSEELQRGFRVYGFCSIKSVIYFQINFVANILAFDFSQEKFQLISFPDEDTMPRMIEVRDCLGLMNRECTKIWILEDFKDRKWNVVNILWPSSWIVNPLYFSNEDGSMFVKPVGSVQSGEILFKCTKRKKSLGLRGNSYSYELSYFCYDMEQRSTGTFHILDAYKEDTVDIYPKHVETLYP